MGELPSSDRRRDRKGRGRRFVAGIVEVALLGAVLWGVVTGGPFASGPTPTPPPTVTTPTPVPARPAIAALAQERVGFIGLPPEGATPSARKGGELVISYGGRPEGGPLYRVWVYADGRLIWWREGNIPQFAPIIPEGANRYSTGYLEQRLTPEGVELLRAEGTPRTALFGRRGRLTYPASWLPARAWKDEVIRAYVPSRYAVCYERWPSAIVAPSRILADLPGSVADALRAGYSEVTTRDVSGGLGGLGCSELTTAEARTFVEDLEDAGIEGGAGNPYRLDFRFDAPGPTPDVIVIWFEPYLPDDRWPWSTSG